MDIDSWYEELLQRRFHLNKKGYAVIYAPECPLRWQSSLQMYRCRYVAWYMGWLTDRAQAVHHHDHVRTNDHPSNLEVVTREEHQQIHSFFSPAHRQHISEALRGRVVSDETRLRIAEGGRGNANRRDSITSPEALANIRAGVAQREARRAELERELRERVAMLTQQGLSSRKVAAAVGVSKDRVLRIIGA